MLVHNNCIQLDYFPRLDQIQPNILFLPFSFRFYIVPFQSTSAHQSSTPESLRTFNGLLQGLDLLRQLSEHRSQKADLLILLLQHRLHIRHLWLCSLDEVLHHLILTPCQMILQFDGCTVERAPLTEIETCDNKKLPNLHRAEKKPTSKSKMAVALRNVKMTDKQKSARLLDSYPNLWCGHKACWQTARCCCKSFKTQIIKWKFCNFSRTRH